MYFDLKLYSCVLKINQTISLCPIDNRGRDCSMTATFSPLYRHTQGSEEDADKDTQTLGCAAATDDLNNITDDAPKANYSPLNPLITTTTAIVSTVVKPTDHMRSHYAAVAGQKSSPLLAKFPLCVQPLLHCQGQYFPVLLLEVPEHSLLAHPEKQKGKLSQCASHYVAGTSLSATGMTYQVDWAL